MQNTNQTETGEGNVPRVTKRLRTITSHVGISRWLAETKDFGWIPRQYRDNIPSPYSCGPTSFVFLWNDKRVIYSETSHKRYEIFELPSDMKVFASDAEALENAINLGL